MRLLKDTNSANFGLPFANPLVQKGVQAAAPAAKQVAKKGLLGKTFDVINAATLPLMMAPLFMPSADTRAQEKMLADIKKNPGLGLPFKVPGMDVNAPDMPPGKVSVGNPNPNMMQPGQLPPGSMR
jgi:hypothetical protein